MNPDTLRADIEAILEERADAATKKRALAAPDAWEAERVRRHMEAAKFLSQIAAWRGSCEAAEQRLEAAEKALYDAIVEGGCPEYEIEMDHSTGRARPAALAAGEET